MKLNLSISVVLPLITHAVAADIWCPPKTVTEVYRYCPNSCEPPRSTYTTTAHPTVAVQPPCLTSYASPSATNIKRVNTSTCPPVYETRSTALPCSSCTYSILPPLTTTVFDSTTVTIQKPCPVNTASSATPTPKPSSSSRTIRDTSSTLSCSYGCSLSDGGTTTTLSALPTASIPPWKCTQWCEV